MIAQQGQAIARQSLLIETTMRKSAAIGREVDQMVGRLRQFLALA